MVPSINMLRTDVKQVQMWRIVLLRVVFKKWTHLRSLTILWHYSQWPKKINSLRIIWYVDAGHANIEEGHSQIGFLTCLADSNDSCVIISNYSRKSRQQDRSTKAWEALALAEAFDMAFTMRADLFIMLLHQLPFIVMTDSEINFNILTRRGKSTEKRLMEDLRAAREAYTKKEISNITLIDTDDNSAEALTKIEANYSLRKHTKTAKVNLKIIQYC